MCSRRLTIWTAHQRLLQRDCGLSCGSTVETSATHAMALRESRIRFSLVRCPAQPRSTGLTRDRAKGFIGVVEISPSELAIPGTVVGRRPFNAGRPLRDHAQP